LNPAHPNMGANMFKRSWTQQQALASVGSSALANSILGRGICNISHGTDRLVIQRDSVVNTIFCQTLGDHRRWYLASDDEAERFSGKGRLLDCWIVVRLLFVEKNVGNLLFWEF